MTNLMDERELIERAKQLDHGALREIYERFSPGILRYIFYRVGDADLAEDLRADVFMRMLEGIERFDYRGWSISAWLYRIAHDRVVDHLRRLKRRQHVALDEQWVDPAAGPEALLSAKVESAALRAALAQLTDEQQQVLLLRFIEDLSIRDVAQIVGRTEGAVKALQHRALASLERLLRPQIQGE